MKTISIVGCGSRGLETYAKFLLEYSEVKITTICDIDESKYERAKKMLEEVEYHKTEEEFFKKKRSDAIIIANLDENHYDTVIKAIKFKYEILLEKPITDDIDKLKEIKDLANENNVRIMVCHVLRYTPFFSKIKSIVAKEKIIGIDLVENIGNYHFAHSYVRGNWKDQYKSTPLIFAKSCHDLDILSWIVDSPIKNVYASGDLNYFKKENKPKGSSDRCYNCPLKNECIYNAIKVYKEYKGKWPTNTFTHSTDDLEIEEILKTSDYGRCVWDSNNNTHDHITSIMRFENNINCTFTVTAFSQIQERRIKIYMVDKTLEADMASNTIKIIKFVHGGKGEFETKIITPDLIIGGHSGGDEKIIQDFVKFITDKNHVARTSLNQSIESHLIANAIMKSITNKDVTTF